MRSIWIARTMEMSWLFLQGYLQHIISFYKRIATLGPNVFTFGSICDILYVIQNWFYIVSVYITNFFLMKYSIHCSWKVFWISCWLCIKICYKKKIEVPRVTLKFLKRHFFFLQRCFQWKPMNKIQSFHRLNKIISLPWFRKARQSNLYIYFFSLTNRFVEVKSTVWLDLTSNRLLLT